jgi:hypothetical protein
MVCGLEHQTRENSAAPLHCQQMFQAIASTWMTYKQEQAVRRLTQTREQKLASKVRRQFNAFVNKYDTKCLAVQHLSNTYLADENCLSAAEWVAFVNGDEFTLAFILQLPYSGKLGASKLTCAIFKRYIDTMSIKIEFNDHDMIVYLSSGLPSTSRASLKGSRDVNQALQVILDLMELTISRGTDGLLNAWEKAINQWEVVTAIMGPTAPQLPRSMYALFHRVRLMEHSSSSSRAWCHEYCECERCMNPYQVTDDEAESMDEDNWAAIDPRG